MITLIGDACLGRISTLLAEFFPQAGVAFIPETEAPERIAEVMSSGARLVVSRGLAGVAVEGTVVVPRIFVDGLSSLEVVGTKVLGAELLPESLDPKLVRRAFDIIARGAVSFRCGERLRASLSDLSGQSEIGESLAQFIEQRYRDVRLFSGADRPDPIVTCEAARLVAQAVGLDGSLISRKEPWRTDQVAYRPSRRVLLPNDARSLGVTWPQDSLWLETLGWIFKHAYNSEGLRCESHFGNDDQFAEQRNTLRARVEARQNLRVAEDKPKKPESVPGSDQSSATGG